MDDVLERVSSFFSSSALLEDSLQACQEGQQEEDIADGGVGVRALAALLHCRWMFSCNQIAYIIFTGVVFPSNISR